MLLLVLLVLLRMLLQLLLAEKPLDCDSAAVAAAITVADAFRMGGDHQLFLRSQNVNLCHSSTLWKGRWYDDTWPSSMRCHDKPLSKIPSEDL